MYSFLRSSEGKVKKPESVELLCRWCPPGPIEPSASFDGVDGMSSVFTFAVYMEAIHGNLL